MSTLEHDLAEIVGERDLLTDPDLRAPYERDCTGRFGAPARLVVRPVDTQQTAAVLTACQAHDAQVVPQGGNTGLVGAGVPRGGEVLLSTARLTGLEPVERSTGQCTVGAGATLASVQAHAHDAGLDFGVDFGARDSATIGGLVATDAGGIRALRHGTMRAQVVGLEAVRSDGTILRRLSGLVKDNAGFDLSALIVGSEGTLAVVTRARLRLIARLSARATVLIGLDSLTDAVAVVADLRAQLTSLEAADFFMPDGLELVLRHRCLSAPLTTSYPVYAVVECAAAADPIDELAAVLDGARGVGDVVVADDTAHRRALWRYREEHPEAILAEGIPHKLDIGVPLDRLSDFADRVGGVVEDVAPRARAVLFGHLGDGNVHVNVLDAPEDDRVDEAVLRLAADLGGTISAEHGVGVAKARWLPLTRSAGEIATMRQIKRALDPAGILNPGAVLATP